MWKSTRAARLLLQICRIRSLMRMPAHYTLPPLALLVDGENVSAEFAVHLLAAVGDFGGATIRYVYGNWSHSTLHPWVAAASRYSFRTMHYAHPVSGKNATDIALTVDAMALFAQGIRHFCVVSSDTDYIPLIRHLRHSGCFVLGIGKNATRKEVKDAYTVFLTTEQLLSPTGKAQPPIVNQESKEPEAMPSLPVTEAQEAPTDSTPLDGKKEQQLLDLLTKAYAMAADKGKSEWVPTGQLGTILKQLEPGFTQKTYGSAKLKDLIQKYPQLFQTQPHKGGQIAIRLKPQE